MTAHSAIQSSPVAAETSEDFKPLIFMGDSKDELAVLLLVDVVQDWLWQEEGALMEEEEEEE